MLKPNAWMGKNSVEATSQASRPQMHFGGGRATSSQGMSGQGVSGQGVSGSSMSAAGMPASGMPGPHSPGKPGAPGMGAAHGRMSTAAGFRPRDGSSPGSPASGVLIGSKKPDTGEPGTLPETKRSVHGLYALIVDDDEQVRTESRLVAEEMGFAVTGVASAADAMAMLKRQPIDVLLLDPDQRAGHNGAALIEEVNALYPLTTVIVMTAHATVNSAVEAMRIGVRDYLSKPFSMEELKAVLGRVAQKQQQDRKSRLLRESLQTANGMGEMIGRSPEMEKMYRILSKVAYSAHPVLILGESGTGKELVSRSIHFNGPMAAKPFVAIDCGSLVPTLIETELFGYVRGAFTGADRAKEGLLAAAEGGTVFLDEIGELPLDLQSRLLRALQEKEVRPVGATFTVPISARVLAATNRNLLAMVEQGKFRKDLYFRLNVVNLKIPPLRERREDIAALAQHFLEKRGMEPVGGVPVSFSEEVLEILQRYDWPGNVRELESAVESICTIGSGPVLLREDLPSPIKRFIEQEEAMNAEARLAEEASTSGSGITRANVFLSIAEMEKQAILDTIQLLGGDKLQAAKVLGIGKTTLYRKLKEYGIADAGEDS